MTNPDSLILANAGIHGSASRATPKRSADCIAPGPWVDHGIRRDGPQLVPVGLAIAVSLAALTTTPAPAKPLRDTGFAQYARARLAYGENDLDAATRGFDAALAADPGDVALKRRAFQMALIAGDARRAEALAANLPSALGEDAELALLGVARAFARGDWTAADKALDRTEGLKLGGGIAMVGRAWARFGRGDLDGALALTDPAKAPVGSSATVGEARARMLAAAGRWPQAAAAYTGLVATGSRGMVTLLEAANAAAHAGDAKGAADFLRADQASGAVEAARLRLAAGQPVLSTVDGPREGMAAELGELAAEFARSREPVDGVVFARIASFTAPDDAQAALLLGEILGRADQPGAALRVLDGISARSIWAGEARGLRARLLADLDREGEARALLERAANAPGALAYDWTLLGEFDANAKRYLQAADDYSRALVIEGPGAGWQAWFARGAAYEQAADWSRAEPDLRHALTLAPKQPVVLNYLGYSLIDRGLRIDEGTTLISRALAASPNDPAIEDSLGWAYFKTGRVADAIALLERAVGGDAGDPTVNEHLGDAYWAVGRRIEARFRWNAAMASGPDAAATKRIAAKIDYGYDRAALAEATPPK